MVRIGIIGMGRWGLNHLKYLSKMDCSLIGISDIEKDKKKIADKYGLKFFSNYMGLLPEVDVVTVAAPTDLHYKIVKDCLIEGKDVLVEKPITVNSDKARELVKLAEKTGRILSVGYLFRFNNSVRRLKELVSKIGDIQYIMCRYIHSTKPPRNDSGVILNLGIHPMDILNFITKRRPFKVFAKKKNLLSDLFEDSAVILLDYNDFFASIEVSCTHPEKKRDIWVIGEKEKIYVDYFNQKIIRYPLRVTYENIKKSNPIEEKIMPNEPLKDELEYFIQLVDTKDRKDVLDTGNIGREEYYTTRICELSIESAITGEEMTIR